MRSLFFPLLSVHKSDHKRGFARRVNHADGDLILRNVTELKKHVSELYFKNILASEMTCLVLAKMMKDAFGKRKTNIR